MMAIDLADYEKGAKYDGDYDAMLAALQERLAQVQVAHIVHEQRAVILFEGWDAAGKGGIIQRLTAEWDPRNFEVWPIAAPTRGGEEAPFPLALLEAAARRRRDRGVRSQLVRPRARRAGRGLSPARSSGGAPMTRSTSSRRSRRTTARRSSSCSSTSPRRAGRAAARRGSQHPWKRWKTGADDFRNRARRDDYLAAMTEMFARTDTRWAPWKVIDGNNKKAARIAALTWIASGWRRPCRQPPRRPIRRSSNSRSRPSARISRSAEARRVAPSAEYRPGSEGLRQQLVPPLHRLAVERVSPARGAASARRRPATAGSPPAAPRRRRSSAGRAASPAPSDRPARVRPAVQQPIDRPAPRRRRQARVQRVRHQRRARARRSPPNCRAARSRTRARRGTRGSRASPRRRAGRRRGAAAHRRRSRRRTAARSSVEQVAMLGEAPLPPPSSRVAKISGSCARVAGGRLW